MKHILELLNSSLCHVEDVSNTSLMLTEDSQRLKKAAKEISDAINAVSRESEVLDMHATCLDVVRHKRDRMYRA